MVTDGDAILTVKKKRYKKSTYLSDDEEQLSD